MEALDQQSALRLLTLFSGAVKGMAFYPSSHPAIRQPLIEFSKILTTAFIRAPQVSWGIIDGTMFFDDHLFVTPSAAITVLTSRMIEKSVGRITVSSGASFDELQLFVRLFSGKAVGFDELSAPSDEQDDDAEVDAEEGDHVATYNKALVAIRVICRDMERGRIPNSAEVIKVVDRMVATTMQEPGALLGLTMIKDYDNYTFNHCVNVGVLGMAMGASLGLDAASVRTLGLAGQLHDIGKTMVPIEILNKPGKLSSAEFDEIKKHPELGSNIVKEMGGLSPQIAQIVLGHHLHYNRSGYPEWASRIPFDQMIDIIAIADTYDAITTLRVYQHPVNPRTALHEMQKLIGTILDGSLLAHFMEMMGDYPVGTLVRLDTNEVAVVYRPNPLDTSAPVVRVLIDGDGRRLNAPREQPLLADDGSRYAGIVTVVDPLLKNLDLGRMISG
jgi:putative nucleotidyltransferase with HDIG domain